LAVLLKTGSSEKTTPEAPAEVSFRHRSNLTCRNRAGILKTSMLGDIVG
jgi:hypothetical protein